MAATGGRRWGVRRGWRWLLRLIDAVGSDHVLGLAAEMAFFAMLSVFPALLILATALGWIGAVVGQDVAQQVEDRVVSALQTVLTSEASGAVGSVQQLFDRQQGRVLTIGVVVALVSVSGVFATVLQALNTAYGVQETRGWWRRRYLGLLSGLVSVLVGALLIAAVVVGPLLGIGGTLADVPGVGPELAYTWNVLRWPLILVVLALWATSLCHLAPAVRTPFSRDLFGGCVTAGLWLAATSGLRVYLSFAAGTNPLLGVLGGGLIIMVWLYLLSLGLLIGGEINALRVRHTPEDPAPLRTDRNPELDDTMIVLRRAAGLPLEPGMDAAAER